MDWQQLFYFLVAATALLGSPGPAIAALLAVGRIDGWSGGIRFYFGLQLGLGTAALITALGLFTLLSAVPGLLQAMALIATAYLLYLSWKIATAPVGDIHGERQVAASVGSGALVGITNPKAYVALASLFASFSVHTDATLDTGAKWIGVVIVMIIVDFAWLVLGVTLGKLAPRAERAFNIILAAMVAVVSILSLLQ